MDLYQIVLVCVMTAGLILYFLSKVFKIDILKTYSFGMPILKALHGVVSAFTNVFPNEQFKTIDVVFRASIEGAEAAEMLWEAGELDKEKKYEYAKKYVEEVLCKCNITVTESLRTIISGVFAVVAYLLPHEE